MATFDELREKALRLPPAERAKLAGELLDSLDEHDRDEIDQVAVERAWDEELERRTRDIDEGREELLPMDEAWKIIRGQ